MGRPQKLSSQVDFLLGLMARFHHTIDAKLGKTTGPLAAKLTLGQMRTLYYLMENGPATMNEVAQNSGVAMSTMSDMANRLVRLGVAERKQDPNDRRIVRLMITRAGIREFERKSTIMRTVVGDILGNYSAHDMEELIKAFKTIEKILFKKDQE